MKNKIYIHKVDIKLNDYLSMRGIIIYQNKKYVYVYNRNTHESFLGEPEITEDKFILNPINDGIFNDIIKILKEENVILTDYKVEDYNDEKIH